MAALFLIKGPWGLQGDLCICTSAAQQCGNVKVSKANRPQMRRATDVKQYHMSVNSNKAEGTFLSTFVRRSCEPLQPQLSCVSSAWWCLCVWLNSHQERNSSHMEMLSTGVSWKKVERFLYIYCGLESEKKSHSQTDWKLILCLAETNQHLYFSALIQKDHP